MIKKGIEIIEYAKLSYDVYYNKNDQKGMLPIGWRRSIEHDRKFLTQDKLYTNYDNIRQKINLLKKVSGSDINQLNEDNEKHYAEQIDTFLGRLYLKNEAETVIAFRGTVPGVLNDYYSDIKLGLHLETSHNTHARNFYDMVKEFLSKNINFCQRPVLTGHSLGGYLAQLIAVEQQLPAIVFNAPKIGGYRDPYLNNKLISSKQHYEQIYNVDVDYDFIHQIGTPIGHTIILQGDEEFSSNKLIQAMIKNKSKAHHYLTPTSMASNFNPAITKLILKTLYYGLVKEHQMQASLRALERNSDLTHQVLI